ncbi:MAG: uncharacterized protein Greene041619_198 [Candidatus Peregrinibacteria bacterium Greene0416_19]|nr:MAG: uncharacterized protein Greene041619_198 [Candidatus Peregrinibacteria bacterium Greene0416_19]
MFLLSALVMMPLTAFAFQTPANDGFLTDEAGIITDQQEQDIEKMLLEYQQQTSNEIAILTVGNLDGEVPADVAVEVGRKWGVGSSKNNGVLILVSTEDRHIELQVGYGLEGAVPDIVATGIAGTEMAPQFREGKYYEGFLAGIDALKKHIGGEYTADRYSGEGGSWSPGVIFFFFILLQGLGAFLGRSRSWWLGGIMGGVIGLALVVLFGWWVSIPILILLGLLFDYIVSRMPHHRRGRGSFWWGGGGGSGGGGFRGFGGGSFGGGGGRAKW